MVNSKQSNIYTHEDLLQFYKRIFGIFYSQSHLSAPIDRKFSKFSHFLNKNSLQCSLFYSICMSWALHWCYCQMKKGIPININLFIILKSFITSISVLSLLFRFEDVKKLWTHLKCLDRLIYKRLNYTPNDYLKFKHSFIYGPVLFPLTLLIISICAAIVNPLTNTQRTAIVFRFIQFYIELHVIFVISLFQYIYKLFGKSINFACNFRRLNLTIENINRIDTMIRQYKEIHYKIWIVSHEINCIFGTSIVAFSLQTFVEATRFLCYAFYRWEKYHADDIFKLTSKDCFSFYIYLWCLFFYLELAGLFQIIK